RALGQLDLTDEQRDKVKALFKEQRDAMRDNMDAMQDNRDELRDAMQKGAGEKAIRGLAEKQGDLVTEMIVNRVQVQEKLNAILTKEQRDELQKMQKERRDDRRDRSDDDDRPRW
ncbi:MAG: Spy/CpxP family protein refolding chaperone, partial [Candidatus Thiodiazotropha sp.]